MNRVGTFTVSLALLLGTVACNETHNVAHKDQVKAALEQADLKDVSVSEDVDKKTITLSGTLHTDDAKQHAADIAKSAAAESVIANQISVEPLGAESAARKIESNVDDGIESNFKAALLSSGLDKQSIRFDSKNAVLTLKGSVKSAHFKQEAEKLASSVPNVGQVINQIEIRR